MKRTIGLGLAALIALAQSVFAADVSGKWVAEMQGRDGQTRTSTFNFKVDGDKLTGTVSSPMGERTISDGKVSGDDISFVVNVEFNGESRKINYSGKVAGDELKMKVGSGERMRDVTAKRASS